MGPWLRGCSVLAVILGVGALFLVIKSGTILRWGLIEVFDKLEPKILSHLPEGLEEGEADRLAQAFAGARRAVSEGSLDDEQLAHLKVVLAEISDLDPEHLTPEKVRSLTASLEGLAGSSGPPSSP